MLRLRGGVLTGRFRADNWRSQRIRTNLTSLSVKKVLQPEPGQGIFAYTPDSWYIVMWLKTQVAQ